MELMVESGKPRKDLKEGALCPLFCGKISPSKHNPSKIKNRIDFGNEGALVIEACRSFVAGTVKSNQAYYFLGSTGRTDPQNHGRYSNANRI